MMLFTDAGRHCLPTCAAYVLDMQEICMQVQDGNRPFLSYRFSACPSHVRHCGQTMPVSCVSSETDINSNSLFHHA